MMVVVMMMSKMMRFTLMLVITMMLMDVMVKMMVVIMVVMMVFLEDAAKGNLRGPDLLFKLFVMQILKHGINIFETRDGARLLKSNYQNALPPNMSPSL